MSDMLQARSRVHQPELRVLPEAVLTQFAAWSARLSCFFVGGTCHYFEEGGDAGLRKALMGLGLLEVCVVFPPTDFGSSAGRRRRLSDARKGTATASSGAHANDAELDARFRG